MHAVHSGTPFMCYFEVRSFGQIRSEKNGCVCIFFFTAAQRACSVVISFAFRMICFDDGRFQGCAEFDIDGVHDVTVSTVGILAAGHNDEELFSCINDLDVVDCQCVIERHGNDSLHGALVKKLSDFDIGDGHWIFLSFRSTEQTAAALVPSCLSVCYYYTRKM